MNKKTLCNITVTIVFALIIILITTFPVILNTISEVNNEISDIKVEVTVETIENTETINDTEIISRALTDVKIESMNTDDINSFETFETSTNNEEDTTVITEVQTISVASEAAYIKNEDEILEIPDIDNSFKGFMDYRTISDTSSVQWDLQQLAYTDENGMRKIGDDYCIALGTYYAKNCGDRFEIVLDTGLTFTAIVGDIKADSHTDYKNQYVPMGYGFGNIIEFIVDNDKIHDDIWIYGDISQYKQFEGSITEIRLIERNETANEQNTE